MAQTGPRVPAALVLGVTCGLLAAASFLPAAIPLTWQAMNAEATMVSRHVVSAARYVARQVESGAPIHEIAGADLELELVHIQRSDGTHIAMHGTPLTAAQVDQACRVQDGAVTVQRGPKNHWAVACARSGDLEILTGRRLDVAAARRIVMVVLVLAVAVGLITAIAVLRLMQPLSQVGRAMSRIGTGERGVEMPTTGLAELDELVREVNKAARAMEDREDAITARISVVQEMARLVAHEIRNPLQSLELFTSLIAAESDEAERRELARSIHTEIQILDQVVHRLLRESAVGGSLRLKRELKPVAPVVEQVVALRREQARAQGVELSFGERSWHPTLVDTALLGRSIDNLVLNALQAVEDVQDPEIRIALVEEDAYISICVDDNGPGIDPQLSDQIFDANVSSKHDGTGLGLTLVRGVVEAHGGYVQAGMSPLGGARFVARIPLRDEEDEEEEAERGPEAA